MAMVPCASCAQSVDEFDTYFSSAGQVCPKCHSAQELSDSAAYREGATGADLVGSDGISIGGGFDTRMTSESVHTETDADGNERYVTTTTSLDIGILGPILRWIWGLFRR